MEEISTFMQGKENKGRHYLRHKLIANELLHGRLIPDTCRLIEQPTTNKEETRHTQQEQHIIECHEIILETENTNMRINDENHSKSPHSINVFNSFLCHYACKDTEIISISWIIRNIIVFLPYERDYYLD